MLPPPREASSSLAARRDRLGAAAGFLVCAAASLALMHHAILPLGSLPLLGKDPAQMVWNLWITDHLVSGGHSPFWTDLVFHPTGANLAHHSLSAGFLPVTLLVKWLSGHDPLYPVYAYRISLWLGYALNLFLCHRLLRRLGYRASIAIPVALAYAFCTFQREHIYPLNHRATFFFPLLGLAGLRLVRRPSRGRAAALAAALAAFLYFSHFAFFLGMAAVAFAAALAGTRAGRRELRDIYHRLPAGSLPLAAAVLAMGVAPFLAAWSRDPIQPWPRSSLSFFSTNLAGLVIPGPTTPLYAPIWRAFRDRAWQAQTGELVFFGYPLLLGVLLGLAATRRLSAREGVWLRAAAWTGGVFLILSLGPTLKILDTDTGIPLPYGWIADLPPLSANRAPYRFLLIASFFWMFVAAAGWQGVLGALEARRTRILAALLPWVLLAWVGGEAIRPLPEPVPVRVPDALRDPPPGPYVNLPLSQVDGFAALLQTFHHQPIVTGYTARHSPAQREQFDRLVEAHRGGSRSFRLALRRLGVRAIVLSPRASPWDVQIASQCGLEIIDLRPAPRTMPGLPLEAVPAGTPVTSPRVTRIEGDEALTFTSPQPMEAREVEVCADQDDAYRIEFRLASRPLGAVRVPASRSSRGPGMTWRVIELPAELRGTPFDTIRITVARRRGACGIGHVYFR